MCRMQRLRQTTIRYPRPLHPSSTIRYQLASLGAPGSCHLSSTASITRYHHTPHYRHVLPPPSATIDMYHFHGTVGIFYVLAANDKQQAICDHVFAQKGDVIRAVVVAPTDRESHSSKPDQEARVSHQRGRLLDPRLSVTQKRSRVPQLSPGVNDLQWHTSQGAPAIDAESRDERRAEDESQSKKTVDDTRIGTGHLRHEYQVMIQFGDDTRTKVKRWAAQIFSTAAEEVAFRVSIMYALPRTKDADIRIVEAMRAKDCAKPATSSSPPLPSCFSLL